MREPEGPLRVLHVAHALQGYAAGGVGRYVLALAGAQRALGARASALGPDELGAPGRGFRASWDAPAPARALADRVRSDAADIVHIHHFSGLGFGLVPAAQDAGARVVVTLHDHGVGCARGQRVDRRGAPCAGPNALRCAACVRPDGLPGPLGARRMAARIAASRALAPDLWLTVAPHLAASLGLDAELSDLPLLEALEPPVPHTGPVRLLWVGSVIPTKGPDRAVRAFASLPAGAATLDLVGPVVAFDGSTRFADALLRDLPPGARWHPAGPVAPHYARADVLLFPSRWDEGCPLVLREAASAGLHIVAADVPGARHALGGYPAVWVGNDAGGWERALAAVVRGALRPTPQAAPSLDAHAAGLLSRYRTLTAGSRCASPSPRSPAAAGR